MLVLIIFFKKRNLRYAVATLSPFSVWILLNFFTTLFTINFFVESSFGFISNFLVITKYRLAMYYFLLDCSANKKERKSFVDETIDNSSINLLPVAWWNLIEISLGSISFNYPRRDLN